MLDNQTIAFIGPGAMAEGMIAGLIRNQLAGPSRLLVAGPRQERGDELIDRYGIKFFLVNADAARQADIVVLSVKPQMLDRVLKGLHGEINPDAMVLSIVAGAPINKISSGLEHDRVVRCMPNTPAMIGEGITVWTAATSVGELHKEMAKVFLSALGQQVYVDEEYYLDMATALSGTGPAYVFLFMEAMVDAGVHLGFPRRIAEQLVAQTVKGSVEYYRRRPDIVHLARLRNEVTSPGGTTAAALYFLDKAGFRTAISRAIWAAFERSQELGKGGQSHSPEQPGQS